MRLSVPALAFSAILAAQPALAQVSGQWTCQWGVRDTSPQKRPAVLMNFQMSVQDGGVASGQGVTQGGAGSFPFQFQGQWTLSGQEFVVQGQQSSPYGPQPFAFGARVLTAQQMSYTYNAPDGNIIAAQCSR